MIKKVTNIFPSKINQEIIKILQNTRGWYFGYDEKNQDDSFEKDQGLALQTFNENADVFISHQTLNMFAFIIANKICDELSITFNKLFLFIR